MGFAECAFGEPIRRDLEDEIWHRDPLANREGNEAQLAA